ncbi:LysR family transcriptional regulator, partial [Streptomyces sp. P5_D11]
MNLEQLQLFVLVAELKSLSKAAIRRDLSASALGRKLAALELESSGPLLHRTGRGVKLTHLGERVLPMAAALLEQAAAIRREMSDTASM